jgi:hypothetical protein
MSFLTEKVCDHGVTAPADGGAAAGSLNPVAARPRTPWALRTPSGSILLKRGSGLEDLLGGESEAAGAARGGCRIND